MGDLYFSAQISRVTYNLNRNLKKDQNRSFFFPSKVKRHLCINVKRRCTNLLVMKWDALKPDTFGFLWNFTQDKHSLGYSFNVTRYRRRRTEAIWVVFEASMKQSHELDVLITELIALSLDAISNNSFVFHATTVVFPHSILFFLFIFTVHFC